MKILLYVVCGLCMALCAGYYLMLIKFLFFRS